MLFEKESSKSYSKGLREGIFCGFEVYRIAIIFYFGNSELDKAEKRIEDLEQEAERQRYLSEKEKNEIRKEVVLLQDTVRRRDRAIAELKETCKFMRKNGIG